MPPPTPNWPGGGPQGQEALFSEAAQAAGRSQAPRDGIRGRVGTLQPYDIDSQTSPVLLKTSWSTQELARVTGGWPGVAVRNYSKISKRVHDLCTLKKDVTIF